MRTDRDYSELLVPGLVDFHVHVGERIAGFQLRDGFADLSKVKGLAGIGVFVTEEASDPLSVKLARMRKDAARNYPGKVFWHLTPVQTVIEDLIPLLAADTDLKFYTTYKPAGLYRSYAEIERWMQDLEGIQPRMLIHCEDDEIVSESSEKHPFRQPSDHCLRRPELAELKAVERILELAVKHDYPVHIVHVSAPRGALLIREAKKHCPKITCETAPHYLLRNEKRLQGKNAHRWLCSPPFRSEESRGLMVELAADGYFDLIASDHCPFSNDIKDMYQNELPKVPCGIPGLQSMISDLYFALVLKGKLSPEQLIRLTMTSPAALMGLESADQYQLSDLISQASEPERSGNYSTY